MKNNYTIIDGKSIKKDILEELKEEVSRMNEKPSFVVIQVGDNEASNVYIKQKRKMAEYIRDMTKVLRWKNCLMILIN